MLTSVPCVNVQQFIEETFSSVLDAQYNSEEDRFNPPKSMAEANKMRLCVATLSPIPCQGLARSPFASDFLLWGEESYNSPEG